MTQQTKSAPTPFDRRSFADPGPQYRGAPLWSWNSQLEWTRLKDQIDHFKTMGMGGFHMHSRVGLDTPYLGDDLMDLVDRCVGYAKKTGLAACLYDEDRWPSGAAGGLALKGHPEYRAKHLLITPRPYGSTSGLSVRASAKAARSENGTLLSRIELEPRSDDTVSYRSLPPDTTEPATQHTRYVYLESNPPSEWFNGETYIDTLNPLAMKAFLDSTHEKYKAKVGAEFGKTVPTIFTDEPQFAHKTLIKDLFDQQDIFLPWTDDLPETFEALHAGDLVDRIAELVWDIEGDEVEVARRRWEFSDHVCERFVHAFVDQMWGWCKQSSIKLIGHMMNEPTLLSQSIAIGEAMRAYRSMDIPGVDMLCERIELNTVKQCSSVARQQHGGAAWAMSEIYGVTNWSMTFEKHKLFGDWQAALGINWRVHHLTPVSMKGESKRDYPAAIGYQSPWYKEYKYIEDHFARVNLALTSGKASTKVAVIHPIESFWLVVGPLRRNMAEMANRDRMFRELTEWLLYGLVDFDFVAESLLSAQVVQGNPGVLRVGKCTYDIVIVPSLKTVRRWTVDILNRFAREGGTVIIAGESPLLVDARPLQCEQTTLAGVQVGFDMASILKAVEPVRELRIVDANMIPSRSLLHQVRDLGDEKIVFISNNSRTETLAANVSFKGRYDVRVLDTLNGNQFPITSEVVEGWTTWNWLFHGCGSFLVHLTARMSADIGGEIVDFQRDYQLGPSTALVKVALGEPNVLLLDYAAFKINDDEWEERTESLRIGNIVRERLGLPLKGEAAAQPWSIAQGDREAKCHLTLKYTFESDADILGGIDLAIELCDGLAVTLDGHAITPKRTGWWVDKDISRIRLCKGLSRGPHVLELVIPFGRVSNTEWVYLLGDFGVELRASRATITPLDQSRLFWGDLTRQGLPFYGGNVTYACDFSLRSADEVVVEFPRFHAPVITVQLGSIKRTVASPPYIADLGSVEAGTHSLVVTCFGDRHNAFGALHLTPGKTWWCSPNEWRTEGDYWQDEYNILPFGIEVAPRIRVKGLPKMPSKWITRDRPVHITIADPIGGPILPAKQ